MTEEKGVEEKVFKAYPSYVDAVLDTKSVEITVDVERGVPPDEFKNEEARYRLKHVRRPAGTKEAIYIQILI